MFYLKPCSTILAVFIFGVSLCAESGRGYCFDDQHEMVLLMDATSQSLLNLDFAEVNKTDEKYKLVQKALELLDPINFDIGVPLEVDVELKRIYWKDQCFVAMGDISNVDDISILIWGWRKENEFMIHYSFRPEGWK